MLEHEMARKMIKAAFDKATTLGISGSVAIIDDGGNLKAFSRMDGSILGSVDSAMRKARTAVSTGMSTAVWFDMFNGEGKVFCEIVAHGTSGMMFLAGGEPIFNADGKLVAGIGFGGGAPDQDAEVVKSAIEVLAG